MKTNQPQNQEINNSNSQKEFNEIDLNAVDIEPQQPKEITEAEKRKNISNIIKSKNITKLTNLLNDNDSIAIMARDYQSIEKEITQEKQKLKRSSSTDELKALSEVKTMVDVKYQGTEMDNKERRNSLDDSAIPQAQSDKHAATEPNLIAKIKAAIQDLINNIQNFFKAKSNSQTIPNENTKLLEGIRDNVKKYSISAVEESQPSVSPSASTTQKKPGGREI